MANSTSIEKCNLNSKSRGRKTYVVEHLDPELEAWSALEYQTIARECLEDEANFLLTSVSPDLNIENHFHNIENTKIARSGIEDLYGQDGQGCICLLDPRAERELSPQDSEQFDVFLFGGILGKATQVFGMSFGAGLMCW